MAPRRSLILAGGGMKVAFQAGALQVLLDEAGLEFDHVDAASGGVFNLAMMCQGLSGAQIADNWRGLPALDVVAVNWRSMLRHPFTPESIAHLERFRRRIFTRWGLDFDAIRASQLEATFNTYNFTRHELAVLEPHEMSEDLLVSAISLPMWFPPVRIDGETYIDSVYISDANVEEAIRRGADELWIVWTVSERSIWQHGFLGNYFSIIETAANGHFRRIMRRIEASNAAIERGEEGEFGRPIRVRLLRGEVPLNYVVNFSADRFTAAVERGVRGARAFLDEQGVPYTPRPAAAPAARAGVSFTEEMRGTVAGSPMTMRLTIAVDSIDAFVADVSHAAPLSGWVEAPGLGGRLSVEAGSTFNLFVDDGEPARKRMLYRLLVRAPDGRALTLAGEKAIDRSSGLGLWHETTTLATRVLEGHVEDAGSEDGAAVLGTGVVRITPRAFARQLASFRASGPSAGARAAALLRFGQLFLGGLWDVYARRLLPTSPV